jgi:hypothetical protein
MEKDRSTYFEIVGQLNPKENTELFKQALELTDRITYERKKVEALISIMKQVDLKENIELLKQALQIINRITDEEQKLEALVTIVEKLGLKENVELLEYILKMEDEFKDNLCRLVILWVTIQLDPENKYLYKKYYGEIYRASNEFEKSTYHVLLFKLVIDRCNNHESNRIFNNIDISNNKDFRFNHKSFSRFCEIFASVFKKTPVTLWHETYTYFSEISRAHFLESFSPSLSSIIYNIGGKEALEVTCKAVQDVYRWWP